MRVTPTLPRISQDGWFSAGPKTANETLIVILDHHGSQSPTLDFSQSPTPYVSTVQTAPRESCQDISQA